MSEPFFAYDVHGHWVLMHDDENVMDEGGNGEDVGVCAWGSAYGRIGTVHIAVIDGVREECCTFG